MKDICQDCFCLDCPRLSLPKDSKGYCPSCYSCNDRILFRKSLSEVCMWRVEYEHKRDIQTTTEKWRGVETF